VGEVVGAVGVASLRALLLSLKLPKGKILTWSKSMPVCCRAWLVNEDKEQISTQAGPRTTDDDLPEYIFSRLWIGGKEREARMLWESMDVGRKGCFNPQSGFSSFVQEEDRRSRKEEEKAHLVKGPVRIHT
jgi:hypothetical protein